MSEFYTFPHIESLARHPEVFALAQVVAMEKVDGTNARFGLVDGAFKVGSRNQELDETDSFGFGAWAREQDIESRLYALGRVGGEVPGDVIVYGEWYGKGIQKRVTYSTGRHFAGFAVRVGRAFLPVEEALAFISSLGLDTAPVLYRGAPDQGILDSLRQRPSATAHRHDQDAQPHEGIVIWPTYPFMDCHGEWVIAKHKNPAFTETASEQGKVVVASDAAAHFAQEYGTPQRFEHVVSTLQADGVDISAPQAIGLVLKAFVEDAAREGSADYEALDKDGQKQANRLLNAVAKQQLAA